MCLDSMGWEHEGQEAGSWDRSVLGFDEAWQDAETISTRQELEHRQADTQPEPELFKPRTDYPKKLDKGKGRAIDDE